MIYEWRCVECDNVQEVTRCAEDYLIPPDECSKCGNNVPEAWRKLLCSVPTHRGFTWGRKGNFGSRPLTCKKWRKQDGEEK